MSHDTLTVTLIGGPTALLEVAGLRFLTDPTFSPPGDYPSGRVTLTKLAGPALELEALGNIDAVLLSHDQHPDNLDPAGRACLASARHVLTTKVGAERLSEEFGGIEGLAPWETHNLASPSGHIIHVTATPARHGPAGIEPLTGEVIGFVLTFDEWPDRAIYVTGDTVWYEGVAEVAERFDVTVVVAFVGAAQTRGPVSLTMTADDAVETARAFPRAAIVPVHHQGWAHFTQSQDDVIKAFAAAGLSDRLHPLQLGAPSKIAW
ncbi:MAG TPA: MBL fold metallo-hydrolase [Ktedonobacterales bacterium]|nr:MBL fold metallo-hydrolase [Ktedonobacterales bacterium]